MMQLGSGCLLDLCSRTPFHDLDKVFDPCLAASLSHSCFPAAGSLGQWKSSNDKIIKQEATEDEGEGTTLDCPIS